MPPLLANPQLQYYYDASSGYYYGGDPPDWTLRPNIPEPAKLKPLAPQQSPTKPTLAEEGPAPEGAALVTSVDVFRKSVPS